MTEKGALKRDLDGTVSDTRPIRKWTEPKIARCPSYHTVYILIQADVNEGGMT